jgi:cation/acetate symporter
LPSWVEKWAKVGLITIKDLNGDGIIQFAEIKIHPDMLVLATPEIAGLPYVIAGFVAAGGLAAALSTADGLLITISNAYPTTFTTRSLTQTSPHPQGLRSERLCS